MVSLLLLKRCSSGTLGDSRLKTKTARRENLASLNRASGKENSCGRRRILADEGLTFSVRWNPFQLDPAMPKEARDIGDHRVLADCAAE